MTDTVAALQRVPLFAGVQKKHLEALASSLRERKFAAGDQVVTEGDQALAFFVIADGTATVDVGGHEKRTLGPGTPSARSPCSTRARAPRPSRPRPSCTATA